MTGAVQGALAESRTRATLRWLRLRGHALAPPIRAAAGDSRMAAGIAAVRRIARTSRLYRWLTPEPDAREIVIDLRRSHTLGGPMRLVERGLTRLAQGLPTATSARITRRALTRPARLVSAVILGFLLGSLVRSWPVSDPLVLGTHAVALCLCGVAVTVGDWRQAFANSRSATLLRSVERLAPGMDRD